ncbi:EamA-like transporter family protein [Noviherbaspirillum suwonense]|uniref:EamA-like transporter family protein n=2 Tax=Noviherbaspirillum suwonense TaxID=1224511 RepID=A0ABY1PVS6_9BURK|nr:EamA-like transporter family protein [Noviherbaspirillum suwonense]
MSCVIIEGMSNKNPSAAIMMIVASTLLFSAMDAATKYLGGFLSVVFVLWTRYTLQAAMMAAVVLNARGVSGFRTAHPRFQALRGLLLATISVLAFFSMRQMPLAEFTAIIMLSPVLITACSGWLLNERIGRLRWLLVWSGFLGTIIVIRPGSGLFGWVVIVPLLAMVVSSAYSLITSRLAVLENPYTTQFYSGFIGSALLLPLMLLERDELLSFIASADVGKASLLLLIGVLGTVGHLLLIMAFSKAGTSSLMPFTYAQIGFAALMSWLFFSHAPDFWAWVGMAMIAASGGATAWLSIRRKT